MTNRRFPMLTVGLVTILIGLHLLVVDKTLFYFSATEIFNGDAWRLVSGHFMHADVKHLMWNCLGLAVLGTLLEHRSMSTLLAALGVGIVFVNVLLLTPFSQLEYYCGLSGVLNTLLVVALWLEWKATKSRLIIVLTCGIIVKTLIEVTQGVSVLTHISWPPYAWSHVAGLLGGLFIVCIHHFRDLKPAHVLPINPQLPCPRLVPVDELKLNPHILPKAY